MSPLCQLACRRSCGSTCGKQSMRPHHLRFTPGLCAAQVFKQTSIFTVTSAAANNESLLAGGALGADQDDVDCFDSDGLHAASDGEQGCAWDCWSGDHDSDGALSRRQRDRCPCRPSTSGSNRRSRPVLFSARTASALMLSAE